MCQIQGSGSGSGSGSSAAPLALPAPSRGAWEGSQEAAFVCVECGQQCEGWEIRDQSAHVEFPAGCDQGEVGQPPALLCADCFTDAYQECDCCSALCSVDWLCSIPATYVSGRRVSGSVCPVCLDEHWTRCDNCGELVARDETLWTADCRAICESCYQDDYFTCEGCDEILPNDDYGGEGRCTNCFEPPVDDSGILDYSENVDDYITPTRATPKDKLLYGVELEVEVSYGYDRGTLARIVLDRIGENFAVVKHDGSLNHGFEVVTTRATYDKHKERWAKLLVNHPSGLKSWDTGTCGMHVHASRAGISPLTLGKLLCFFGQNKPFIESVAGRDCSRWADVKPKKVSDARKGGSNRYEAINLCNYKTVEFRIFKGTLSYQGFLKNLEFVIASIKFCQSAGLNELTQEDFLDFLASAPRLYPNLSAWLRERALIPSPNSRPRTQTQKFAKLETTANP